MALLNRIPTEHSIDHFRRAARQRFAEANRCAQADDLLIGIYLSGYAAGMILKAAYFRAIGKKIADPITFSEIQQAKKRATSIHGILWPGSNLHNLIGWAKLVIEERRVQGHPYASLFAANLIAQIQRLYANWREYLRYHGNRPRAAEVADVFQAVGWLFGNESVLIR